MPGGNSALMLGNSAYMACDSSSGLAVACLMIPSETAGRPLKRTELRSLAAPISTFATSPMRTG